MSIPSISRINWLIRNLPNTLVINGVDGNFSSNLVYKWLFPEYGHIDLDFFGFFSKYGVVCYTTDSQLYIALEECLSQTDAIFTKVILGDPPTISPDNDLKICVFISCIEGFIDSFKKQTTDLIILTDEPITNVNDFEKWPLISSFALANFSDNFGKCLKSFIRKSTLFLSLLFNLKSAYLLNNINGNTLYYPIVKIQGEDNIVNMVDGIFLNFSRFLNSYHPNVLHLFENWNNISFLQSIETSNNIDDNMKIKSWTNVGIIESIEEFAVYPDLRLIKYSLKNLKFGIIRSMRKLHLSVLPIFVKINGNYSFLACRLNDANFMEVMDMKVFCNYFKYLWEGEYFKFKNEDYNKDVVGNYNKDIVSNDNKDIVSNDRNDELTMKNLTSIFNNVDTSNITHSETFNILSGSLSKNVYKNTNKILLIYTKKPKYILPESLPENFEMSDLSKISNLQSYIGIWLIADTFGPLESWLMANIKITGILALNIQKEKINISDHLKLIYYDEKWIDYSRIVKFSRQRYIWSFSQSLEESRHSLEIGKYNLKDLTIIEGTRESSCLSIRQSNYSSISLEEENGGICCIHFECILIREVTSTIKYFIFNNEIYMIGFNIDCVWSELTDYLKSLKSKELQKKSNNVCREGLLFDGVHYLDVEGRIVY